MSEELTLKQLDSPLNWMPSVVVVAVEVSQDTSDDDSGRTLSFHWEVALKHCLD